MDAVSGVLRWGSGPGRAIVSCVLVVAIVLAGASLLSGPRGLDRTVRFISEEGTESVETRDKHLRWDWPAPPAEPRQGAAAPVLVRATWEGWLDLPLQGRYRFFLKARGVYSMTLDGQLLFANDDPATPQHIPRAAVELEPGLHSVQIAFAPDQEGGGVFRLFWQWPGEGILLEPLNAQYLSPRELSPVEQAATALWRNGFLLALLAVLTTVVATQPLRQRRRVATPSQDEEPEPAD